MRRFIRGLIRFFAAILLVAALGLFLMIACSPKITKAQLAMMVDIRNACQVQVEQAYWLMLEHVPATDDMKGYYANSEDVWDEEAHALMLEAEQIAQALGGKMVEPTFTFFKAMGDDPWYMILELHISTSFHRVYLIYCPFEYWPLGSWKVLDDQPYWFYDAQMNA